MGTIWLVELLYSNSKKCFFSQLIFFNLRIHVFATTSSVANNRFNFSLLLPIQLDLIYHKLTLSEIIY